MLKNPSPFDPVLPDASGTGARDRAREGWALARDRDLAGALRCFQQALDADIDSYEAWLGLAQIFLDLHDTRRAVRCLSVSRRLRRRLGIGRAVTA